MINNICINYILILINIYYFAANNQNEDSIAYSSDAETGIRHKRYSANPINDDLGFLGAKSTKRQGDGGKCIKSLKVTSKYLPNY